MDFFQHPWQAGFHLCRESWDVDIQAQGVVSDVYGNLESRKSFILNKILNLDQETEGSTPMDDTLIERANLQTELEETIKSEQISWLRLKQGDNNTGVFS